MSSVKVPIEFSILPAALSLLGFFMLSLILSSITAIFVTKTSRAADYQAKVYAVMSDLKALQVPKVLAFVETFCSQCSLIH